ncbi:hypothetical protein EV363DRAFT_1540589 [Boletus edulis]|nr:hypothetical protein EV363DRAFT_1540589 [Boletus edulis]
MNYTPPNHQVLLPATPISPPQFLRRLSTLPLFRCRKRHCAASKLPLKAPGLVREENHPASSSPVVSDNDRASQGEAGVLGSPAPSADILSSDIPLATVRIDSILQEAGASFALEPGLDADKVPVYKSETGWLPPPSPISASFLCKTVAVMADAVPSFNSGGGGSKRDVRQLLFYVLRQRTALRELGRKVQRERRHLDVGVGVDEFLQMRRTKGHVFLERLGQWNRAYHVSPGFTSEWLNLASTLRMAGQDAGPNDGLVGLNNGYTEATLARMMVAGDDAYGDGDVAPPNRDWGTYGNLGEYAFGELGLPPASGPAGEIPPADQ